MLTTCLHGSAWCAEDGQLTRLRHVVRESTETEQDHRDRAAARRYSQGRRDEDDQQSFREFCGELVFLGITSPFWAPVTILQDHHAAKGSFRQYPYEDGHPGWMSISKLANEDEKLRGWTMRMDVEYADSFNHMARLGGHLLLQSNSRWGLDGQADYRYENLAPGN